MKTIPVEEYEPFGNEWKKEVSKMTKPMLVALLRNSLINLQNLKYKSVKNNKGWIDVSELPTQEQGFYPCFTFGKDGNRRHSQFNCLTKHFQTLNFDVIEVTHWMPLPDKPISTIEK